MSFFRDNMDDGSAQHGYYCSLVDIEEIAIFKGPGLALLGSSASGASIHLITKKPQREFALETGASDGSFATRSAFGDVTGAISGGAAGRLIINTEASNGYRNLKARVISVFAQHHS